MLGQRGIIYINGKLFMSASRGIAIREFVKLCDDEAIYQRFHLYFQNKNTVDEVKD